MRWFTADLHFGHSKILKYCDRPFHDVGSMNAAIIAEWNSRVDPEDEVWILGDLAMGSIEDSLQFAGQLVGVKHLVVGNHDRPFSTKRHRPEWTEKYLQLGGLVELHHGEVDMELLDGTLVRACHFPYEGDSGERDRYISERPVDDGRWLLHGHVHERWRQRGRMINVGVDVWGGGPVLEEDLVELVRGGEAHLDRLPWS